ncbi:Reverse transcriptase domain [Arabidopsis suecica]|uniref:Reverse transcriptase domain n=1 Tax=Arabidopsis suecica TaxID=45249 RepID=A0A8T1ZV06_ARASU|nr:Reverse transcriptase domain [Arabidopsis suecica]
MEENDVEEAEVSKGTKELASSSSSILKEKSSQSGHSTHVAAQLSSHSASLVAANRPHSSGGVENTPTVRPLREIPWSVGCVRSVKYQFLINGAPYGEIIPTRGLRQGDPLSPYLFVFCTEMLVKMLQGVEKKSQITRLKVSRGAPPITHLLFADDSMFYYKEKDEELSQIIQIIEEYSLSLGQRVNYQTSCVHFGKHIPKDRKDEVKRRLGIDQEGGDGVYLALEVVNKAREDMEEWKSRKEPQPRTKTQRKSGDQRIKWKTPSLEWVKCNTDGAWFEDLPDCGVGWALRDNAGQVMWLGVKALPRLRSVLETELEALRWAVISLSRFNYRKIIFESDS